MQADLSLPPFNLHGFLPEGVHETTLDHLRARFAINSHRVQLWGRLEEFLAWVIATKQFSHVYIDGGYITSKAQPEDIDVILQTSAFYGTDALKAMEPFFARGMETIREKYSVDLHFWSEGFPGGPSDFRRFFQYIRPQDAAPLGLREGARKGIVRIQL
jgi:hypothetical protein